MKRKITALLLACLLLSALSLPAFAEDYEGKGDWSVDFNGTKVVSNFETANIDDLIYGMQPGDTVTIELAVKNTSGETVSWYMTNEVLESLEDAQTVAEGGAYTYELFYQDSKGKNTTLYSSDAVGGETEIDLEGLHQATDSLEEYFFLDEMASKKAGRLTLRVALDGETQGNAYQNTLAKLSMNFAVEVRDSTNNPPPVYTGDDRSLTPYLIACGVSGLALLVLGFVSLRRKKEDEVTEE